MPDKPKHRDANDELARTLPPRKLTEEELDKVTGGAQPAKKLTLLMKDC